MESKLLIVLILIVPLPDSTMMVFLLTKNSNSSYVKLSSLSSKFAEPNTPVPFDDNAEELILGILLQPFQMD